jgi:hypothetical protein
MRKGAVIAFAFIFLLAIAARAQEGRSEVSAQGTGFLPKTAAARVCRAQRQTLADSWWETAITSLGSSQRKGIMVLTEILKSISLTLQNPE